jgi:DNA-binding CsgD family transcriptional regulator
LCTQKYPQPDRFFAAAVAAAQFRLHPSPATSVDAHTRAATAPWPWLDALIGCWRGELLGDIDAGRAALDLFDDIGARRGVKRAETVLRRLGAPVPRQRHSRGGLSTRELEIAGLVADGLSNTQIAAFLFVNRATVASHVTHILTKLDFSSRTQIATWFATRSAT